MAILEVSCLKKIYTTRLGGTRVQALHSVSFSVEKGEKNGRTFTNVDRLDRQGRVEELARLIGGAAVTDVLRRSAEELLEQAETYHKK